jgi:predicted dehydrogenase
MLSRSRPDLVFDVVVPSARRDVVRQALASGAHVLSEKPMAASMAEARDLIAAAAAAERTHAVIQNRRYLPGIRRARAFLASGVLGDLTAVHVDFFIGAHFGGFRDAMEHALLLDMAIHTFDAARYIIGTAPLAVYAREGNPKGSWYAHGATADALFDFEGGVSMTYRGSWCAEGAHTSWEASWRIIGTRGTLIWDGNEGFSAHVVAADEGFMRPLAAVAVPTLSTSLIMGHAGVIHDFVQSVATGRRPLTDGTDNIQSLAMVFAAIDSASTGTRRPVLT